MKILLPVAGPAPFFPPEEFPFSKPLIEIAGRPMIAWAVDNLRTVSGGAEFVLIALQQDAVQFSYPGIFRLVAGEDARTVLLGERTAGALCSCLMAIEQIDLDRPLMIANYDQIVDGELHDLVARFEALGADAGVLTFAATHPRWSYVRTEGDAVVQASEKRVISRQAIAGLYWFARGADFVEAAKDAIRAADAIDGNYYIASTLNQMILRRSRVVAIPMRETSRLHSFYLPALIHGFEQEITLAQPTPAIRREEPRSLVNIVIPAAGEGSRFAAAGYRAPKPFIDVAGRSMIERVIDNVAVRDARFTLLLRGDHLGAYPAAEAEMKRRDAAVVPVEALTEGTACTVLLARPRFDNDDPLLVANSDQLVDFDAQDFVDDARRRGLDGSILVFRDPARDPKWSFARLGEDGLVTEVAEKRPISDLATVGIYLFMRGSAFVAAAIDMIAVNERVNGEFYTCPVYNYMIRAGARVGVYEVAPEAMSGLGTPADLEAYLAATGGAPSLHAPLPEGEGEGA